MPIMKNNNKGFTLVELVVSFVIILILASLSIVGVLAYQDFADLKKSGCDIIASQNGFIVYRAVADEAEIITIGVHPDAHHTGIANAMLVVAEQDLRARGIKKLFLEVAENNAPARKLYERAGFYQIGIRPKYYDGNDAIMMEKEL